MILVVGDRRLAELLSHSAVCVVEGGDSSPPVSELPALVRARLAGSGVGLLPVRGVAELRRSALRKLVVGAVRVDGLL
jgi:hypothetical protein